MQKKLCFKFLSVLIMLFSLVVVAHADVSSLLLGLSGGEIVSVNTSDWKIEPFETKNNKYDIVTGMKYFPCCNKVVAEVLSDWNLEFAIVDLKSKEINYVDTSIHGLRTKIISIAISSTDPDVIYVSTSDTSGDNINESDTEGISAWNNLMLYGKYNIESNTWEKVSKPQVDELSFFPYGHSPEKQMMQNKVDFKLLQEKNILRADVEDDKLLYSNNQYVIARRDGNLLILDKNNLSLDAAIISPDGFATEDPRLLSPNFVLPIPNSQ